MISARRVFQAAASNFLVTSSGQLLQVFVLLALARWLPLGQFGAFVLASSLLSILGLFGRLGFDTATIRFAANYQVSRDWSRLKGYLRFSEGVVLASSLSLAVLLALTVWAFRDRLTEGLPATLWVGCLLLPVSGMEALRAARLQAYKRVVVSSLIGNVLRPALLGCLALIAFSPPPFVDPTGAAALTCQLLATAVAVGVGSLLLGSSAPTVWRGVQPDYSPRRFWGRTALPLNLVSGLRIVLARTDILMVGALMGGEEAAVYATASRLAQLVSSGLAAANSITRPMVAELSSVGRRDSMQRLVNLTTTATSLWSLITAAILIAAAPFLLGLFGSEFERGAPVLSFLAIGHVMNGITGPVGILMNMTGHERENARILAYVAALNLLLGVPAILGFGAAGAAAVTGGLMALKNLWTWRTVKRRLGICSTPLGRLSSR